MCWAGGCSSVSLNLRLYIVLIDGSFGALFGVIIFPLSSPRFSRAIAVWHARLLAPCILVHAFNDIDFVFNFQCTFLRIKVSLPLLNILSHCLPLVLLVLVSVRETGTFEVGQETSDDCIDGAEPSDDSVRSITSTQSS